MSISIPQFKYIKRNNIHQIKIMLATIVIIVAVAVAVPTGATTALTSLEIFAQNESSSMDQLINDCM